VDIIISNCVINLSPDKRSVFREAFRVLRPGGRLAISDIIATAQLPEAVRNDLSLYSSCIGGAVTIGELETMLRESGFHNIQIQPQNASRQFIREWAAGRSIEEYIASAVIEGVKPSS
jgi:ubiquinone/menaquinone biosynthesis C-methylase UbiE